ncbi:MAG: hypothetical protein Q9O62_02945 [Ardenticatenia bacterium]|nr:hypothetical protein [Ardenticatenia bacterium]
MRHQSTTLFILVVVFVAGIIVGQSELLNPRRAELQAQQAAVEIRSQERLLQIREQLYPSLLWARELIFDTGFLVLSVSISGALLFLAYTVGSALYFRLTGHHLMRRW